MRFDGRLKRLERALLDVDQMSRILPATPYTDEEREAIFSAMLSRFGMQEHRQLVLDILRAPNFTPELASRCGGRQFSFDDDGSNVLAEPGVDVVDSEFLV